MLTISSSSDSQQISNEQLVKLKHKLEDNVIWFLTRLPYVETRELELITAKILDAAEKEADISEKRSLLLKVELLGAYHELRQNRQRRFKPFLRFWDVENPKILLQQLVDTTLVPKGLKLDELPNRADISEAVFKLSK